MDNHGTPAPSNSQIRQNIDALFPNRRVTQNVEDPEALTRRNTENVADENNEATPIVTSSGGEDDFDDGEAERRRKGKMVVSAEPKRKGKATAREIPSGILIREQEDGIFESESETDSEDERQLKVAIWESLNTQNVEAPEPSEAERRRKQKAAAHDNSLGAEYDREFDATILESLKSYYNELAVRSLDAHALRTETGLARGNIGNDSTSNPAMELANASGCPNEDRVDEGAQTEALDTVKGNESPKGKRKIKAKKPKMAKPDVARGKFINSSGDAEATCSMPRQRVSSRGRLLKPTSKLLELSNMTDAPAGEGASGSKKKVKKHPLSNVIARARLMPRLPVSAVDGSDATLASTRKRKVGAEVGVSEPSGSGAVVGQAVQANGMTHQANVVDPNGSGVGGEVGVFEPDADYWIPDLVVVFEPASVVGQAYQANGVARQADVVSPNGAGVEVGLSEPRGSGSVAGQANGVNTVGRQTNTVVPFLEPMVCVTNRNPMDFTIEEAKKYMRTE